MTVGLMVLKNIDALLDLDILFLVSVLVALITEKLSRLHTPVTGARGFHVVFRGWTTGDAHSHLEMILPCDLSARTWLFGAQQRRPVLREPFVLLACCFAAVELEGLSSWFQGGRGARVAAQRGQPCPLHG